MEYKVIAQYIHSLCGVNLDPTKTYLIENRLSNLVEEAGCKSFSEFYYKAKSDSSQTLPRRIIDAITTGETLFFRDTAPFELLQHKLLPELIDRRNQSSYANIRPSIRIWSAACSSGQEVYSIAILLKELLGDPTLYNIRLLGTDISNQAIAQASRGIYSRIEIERGLTNDKLSRYFTHHNNGWKIQDEIRALSTFKHLNLLDNFSTLGKFDIILCRNVAIYFSEADKISLFNRITQVLEPDGALIIGATESITGITKVYEPRRYLRTVYYQPTGNKTFLNHPAHS